MDVIRYLQLSFIQDYTALTPASWCKIGLVIRLGRALIVELHVHIEHSQHDRL